MSIENKPIKWANGLTGLKVGLGVQTILGRFVYSDRISKERDYQQSTLEESKSMSWTKELTGRLLGFQEPHESVGFLVGFFVGSQGPDQESEGLLVGLFVDFQGPDQESVGLLVGFFVGFQAPDQESAGLLVGLAVFWYICSRDSSERGEILRLYNKVGRPEKKLTGLFVGDSVGGSQESDHAGLLDWFLDGEAEGLPVGDLVGFSVC